MGESEKKEMDAYGIPVTSRPRYFAFKVFGGWSAAGILLTLLLRCYSGRSAAERDNARAIIDVQNEARKQARIELKEDYEYMMRVLEQKDRRLDEVEKKLDSVKSKI